MAAAPPQGDSAAAAPRLALGVVLFPGFEPLDVVGPVSVIASLPPPHEVEVVYIAQQAGPVTSVTGAMTVVAGRSFAQMQPAGPEQPAASSQQQQEQQQQRLDWLLVPGGLGARTEAANPELLAFLRAWADPASGARLVFSVCTGSALLAAAGVLDGRRATSNKVAWAWATSQGPRVDWVRRARWVRDGRFLTSSGVSAGTDAAVALVKEALGPQAAAAAAKRLEHVPVTAPDDDPFADDGFVPRV